MTTQYGSFIIAIIVGIGSLLGGNGMNNKIDLKGKEIVAMQYSYGGFFGGWYDFRIAYEGDTPYLIAKGNNGIMLNYKQAITKEQLNKLATDIEVSGMAKWNGFDKSNKNVLDGSSFNINIEYKDGTTLKAYGYMEFPEGYTEKVKILSNFFFDIIEANTTFDKEHPGEMSTAYVKE